MHMFKRLWPLYRPGLPLVVLSLVQIALVSLLSTAQPQIIRFVTDLVLEDGQWQYLVPGALAVIGVAVVQGGLRFGQRYTMELVSTRVVARLRAQVYSHLQRLSFAFYDQAQTGELMSRATADVDAVRMAAGMALVNGLTHLGSITAVVVAMFLMDWRLAVVSLLFLPLLVHAIARFQAGSRAAWGEVQAKTAHLSATLQENISGVRVVKAFAREEGEIARFREANESFQAANLRAIRLSAFWTNYMNFLTAVGAVAVLWYGGRRAIDGAISVGTLVAFNAYVTQLVGPVRMLGMAISPLHPGRGGAAADLRPAGHAGRDRGPSRGGGHRRGGGLNRGGLRRQRVGGSPPRPRGRTGHLRGRFLPLRRRRDRAAGHRPGRRPRHEGGGAGADRLRQIHPAPPDPPLLRPPRRGGCSSTASTSAT